MPRSSSYIDASGTGTFAQLQNLYANPSTTPQQVDSNLFLQDSRLSDWASRSGEAAGIGNDPASYFQNQAAQRTVAAMQAQRDSARLQGYDQFTSPDFIHRQQVEGQIAAADQQRNQIASLQADQQRQQQYQLPTTGYHIQGGAPILSPLGVKEAAGNNMSQMEYLLRMRSGSGLTDLQPPNTPYNPASPSAVPFIPAGTNSTVDPDTLYKDPRFQTHLQYNPQHAQGLFSALTGQDFKGYQERQVSTNKEDFTHSKAYVQKMIEDQNLRQQPNGIWEQRQLEKNITSGKMELGDKFGAPTPQVQEHIKRGMGAAFPLVQEMQDLQARKTAHDAEIGTAQDKANATRRAALIASGRGLPAPTNTEGYAPDTTGTFGGGILGSLSDATDLFTGNFGNPASFSNAPMVQTGANPVHVRQQLQNDPVFAALMQRNPASAREYIARLQKRNVAAPAPAASTFDPNSYGSSY